MTKRITFTCDEKIEKELITVKQGIYNGFGKMVNLPPRQEYRFHEHNFDTKELGDSFIKMGELLKQETSEIKNMTLNYALINNPANMGKQFMVMLSYEIVGVQND